MLLPKKIVILALEYRTQRVGLPDELNPRHSFHIVTSREKELVLRPIICYCSLAAATTNLICVHVALHIFDGFLVILLSSPILPHLHHDGANVGQAYALLAVIGIKLIVNVVCIRVA